LVAVALRPDPAGGVAVPLVLASGEGPEAGFDVFPAALVLERAAHGLGDERAALPPPDAPVEACHDVVVEAYVQSHGHKLAHSGSGVPGYGTRIVVDILKEGWVGKSFAYTVRENAKPGERIACLAANSESEPSEC
jgi:hypothetical protein